MKQILINQYGNSNIIPQNYRTFRNNETAQEMAEAIIRVIENHKNRVIDINILSGHPFDSEPLIQVEAILNVTDEEVATINQLMREFYNRPRE